MTTVTKNNNIDRILSCLGDIGWYQLQVFLQSTLPVFIAGMLSISFVFTTAIPEHRCFIENCDKMVSMELSQIFNRTFLTFTTPINMTQNSLKFDRCHNYKRISKNNNNCSRELFDEQTLIACNNHVFNDEYFRSTIVTEFKLFCHKEWIVQLLQSIFFFGVLVGAILNGILADKYGRRMIFRIYSPLVIIGILLNIFAFNLHIYAIGLFIKGICCAAIYQSAFTVGIECLGGSWRFWFGNSYSIIFAFGGIYACFMAYLLRSWKQIEISNLIPSLLMLPYPFILSESIRWQFSSGKSSNAIIQVTNAAKKNGIKIPQEIIDSYFNESNQQQVEYDQSDVSIKELFTHRLIRTWTITFLYIWFTNALVYYGLAFLASDINENIYLSMVLLMAVEIPGVLLISYLGEFTRKYILMGIMILGGISCIICSFVPNGYLKMWLAITGKMSISGSFSLIYIYAAEIFPTVLRITGLGMCSFCARFGAMIAPYLLRLHLFGDSFPFLVIGIITLLAGFSSIILPETKDKKLPDSLEEVEQLKYSKQCCYSALKR